jgi:hypothetical protein
VRGAATGDGYVRLTPTSAQVVLYGTPRIPNAILFADLAGIPSDAELCVRRVRELPYSQFLGVTRLVVRLPYAPRATDEEERTRALLVLDELDAFLPQISPAVQTVNVLAQRFGRPPALHTALSVDTGVGSDTIVRRIRAAELSALLESNHAVWAPDTYHFRLPNGLHASSFVRLADGFSNPRDVEVIASWLMPDLAPGRGLIFDNRSLTPLAISLGRLHDHVDLAAGPMTFLEHYLDTQFGIETAVREAASAGGGVLGVLSVSSAGHTRDRILAAFDRAGQPQARLHVLLDRSVTSDSPLLGSETLEVSTWLGFSHSAESASKPEQCAACTRQDKRRVVAIDPRFFDGMVLPNPTLTMLNPVRAQRAAPFWEACDDVGAVALEHKSEPSTKSRRSQADDKSGRMAVYVSIDRLLDSDVFLANARLATSALLKRHALDGEISTPSDALTDIDTVVVSTRDSPDGDHGDRFRTVLDEVLGLLPGDSMQRKTFVVDHETDPATWDSDAITAIKASARLLIVGAGTVSGYSMQKMLVGCQEHLRGAENPQRLSGLLFHARPATLREWTTLQNSYGRQLYALFATLLPTVSPLRREADTLSAIRRHTDDAGEVWKPPLEQFLAERTQVCEGSSIEITQASPAPYAPLLWGLPTDLKERATIRQHSLFGHKLGPAAFFGAVGSSVHGERERIAEISGPVWHLFEMPALLRSYYDVLLLMTMLRWMDPVEIWWGEHAVESVTALLDRATADDDAVLVPELLLAAAHGKLPLEAAEVVELRAIQLLGSPHDDWTEREVSAVGAGLLAWRSERLSRKRLPVTPEPLPPWPASVTLSS